MVQLPCPACPCGKYFDSREALKIHLATLTENVSCPECQQSFSSIADLMNHLDSSCSDESRNRPACDPEVELVVPECMGGDESTIVEEGDVESISGCNVIIIANEDVRPGAGSDMVLSADGAADINVDNYIPIGIDAKEEPEAANDNDEETEESQCYYCSSCECNIDSVIEHISMYHPNETVEYEGAQLTMETDPAASGLMPETIISDMIEDPEPDQFLDHATGSEKPNNKVIEKNLPRTPEELQEFLLRHGVIGETSPGEILPTKSKRRRQYIEKEVEDEDGNTSIVYSCEKCSREFTDLVKFKLHRCPLQGPRLKVCPVCREGFESPVEFIIHFREKHPTFKPEILKPRNFVRKMIKERNSESLVSGFSCTRCARDFFDEPTWKHHKCTVPEYLHKECPICFKKFISKRNYNVHLRNHGLKHMAEFQQDGKSSKMFQCVRCDREFESRSVFQLHKCALGEMKEYECAICSTKLSTKVGLSSHMRMHKPEEEKRAWKIKQQEKLRKESDPLNYDFFQCQICDERLLANDKDVHMKMHEGKLICCPVRSCNKNFASQELLEHHSQVHNEIAPQTLIFKCFYCHQKFVEKDKFLEHVKKHKTPDRSYQCTYCGRGFQKPNERIKHEWVHTGKQPYVCLTCGMRFRKTFCLLTHERIHTGYRPYTCDTCGKSFRTRSAFTHHLRIHSDLRMFQCKVCPKTFKTAVQLANHRNSHTKPFTCNLCNRRFINSYSMRRHMTKHPTLEHYCDICGAAYGRQFELRDHLIEAHGRPKSPAPPKRKGRKANALVEHSYDAVADS